MSIGQRMLPEFDHEMANTRKMLEVVPEGKFDWKPHTKSFSLQGLVTHLVNVPAWTAPTLKQPSMDIAPKDGEPYREQPVKSKAEALEKFDKNVTDARQALASTDDAAFMQDWSLLGGGEVYFTMPRIAVMRSFIMNHMIHHRAHLGVYLRLLDVPVPGMYGPSADEAM